MPRRAALRGRRPRARGTEAAELGRDGRRLTGRERRARSRSSGPAPGTWVSTAVSRAPRSPITASPSVPGKWSTTAATRTGIRRRRSRAPSVPPSPPASTPSRASRAPPARRCPSPAGLERGRRSAARSGSGARCRPRATAPRRLLADPPAAGSPCEPQPPGERADRRRPPGRRAVAGRARARRACPPAGNVGVHDRCGSQSGPRASRGRATGSARAVVAIVARRERRPGPAYEAEPRAEPDALDGGRARRRHRGDERLARAIGETVAPAVQPGDLRRRQAEHRDPADPLGVPRTGAQPAGRERRRRLPQERAYRSSGAASRTGTSDFRSSRTTKSSGTANEA